MSRQTPTSRRSPSILVTDVRHEEGHSAPFVSRRLNAVSVESLLSNTSEVPSAQRRIVPRRSAAAASSTSNYGSTHRSRMAAGNRRSETTPLLSTEHAHDAPNSGHSSVSASSHSNAHQDNQRGSQIRSQVTPRLADSGPNKHQAQRPGSGLGPKPVKPVPQLTKSLPSRTSKQSHRLVLIPESEHEPESLSSGRLNNSTDDEDDGTMRVTSYLVSEGILLPKAAAYLKSQHRARVRLYDEALFADYLLPLLPGNGVDFRVMSSTGDNRTMERMIDISEQRDHHYEYFSSSTAESDPSEPQTFSPRPKDAPIDQNSSQSHESEQEQDGSNSIDGHDEQGSAGANSATESTTSTVREGGDNAEPRDAAQDKREEERRQWERERKLERYTSHAEVFVFNYGVVVFWNFTESQEKQILADLCIGDEDLVIHPYNDQEIESEELKFTYALDESEKPQIYNDLITLNSNTHMLKLAMSHAMAQSTILCGFEERMQTHLKDVRGVPKTLALTGKLGMNREQLLKISGRLFKLRVDVNLSSNVLDIPEFFWDSEPSLFPLFNALREYLEIDERVLVLNERQSVFLELTSILGDSIAEFNMDRITIIVIWLIILSICVSLTEIGVRFLILRRAG